MSDKITTPKRKPGRPAGSGIYTVRRQIVLDPQLAEAWREMVARIGGTESARIREAMWQRIERDERQRLFDDAVDAAPKS